MRPIVLEIITQVITTYNHCRHCEVFFEQAGLDKKFHQREMDEYPSDLKEEFIKLSDWIRELTRLYKHRLLVKHIDVQSLLGIYKSMRYRIRRYPTFIIEGKETYTGWDRTQLEAYWINTSRLLSRRNIDRFNQTFLRG